MVTDPLPIVQKVLYESWYRADEPPKSAVVGAKTRSVTIKEDAHQGGQVIDKPRTLDFEGVHIRCHCDGTIGLFRTKNSVKLCKDSILRNRL
jgi:hypothetical protein